jgi:hypothetical protein
MSENNVIDIEQAKHRKRRSFLGRKDKAKKEPSKGPPKWKLYLQFAIFLLLMAYMMKECGRA